MSLYVGGERLLFSEVPPSVCSLVERAGDSERAQWLRANRALAAILGDLLPPDLTGDIHILSSLR